MGRPTERDKVRRLRLLMRVAAAAVEKRERDAAYSRVRQAEQKAERRAPAPVRHLTPAEREAYARQLAKR